MWDGRKYSLITTVMEITDVVVSKGFYCLFSGRSFTLVSEVLAGLCRVFIHVVSLAPITVNIGDAQ